MKEFVKEDKSTYMEEVYSHYELNDPNMQFLLITDNLNNLQQEVRDGRLMTDRETINLWSRNYCRLQIGKHFGWNILNIIQQSAESEKPSYDLKNNLNIEKCKPSLDGLGGSKECQRDHFIILGIFSPDRFGIKKYPEYNGYDIQKLRDNFRSLIILKSNISRTNIEIPMLFNGACSLVRELPKPEEVDYNKINIWN